MEKGDDIPSLDELRLDWESNPNLFLQKSFQPH